MTNFAHLAHLASDAYHLAVLIAVVLLIGSNDTEDAS